MGESQCGRVAGWRSCGVGELSCEGVAVWGSCAVGSYSESKLQSITMYLAE